MRVKEKKGVPNLNTLCKQTSILPCDNSDSSLGRPSITWDGYKFRRGPSRISKDKIRRLVITADEQLWREGDKRRAHLKRICEKFHKDVQKHFDYVMNCHEKHEIGMWYGKSYELVGIGLQPEQAEMDGQMVLMTKFVVTLK